MDFIYLILLYSTSFGILLTLIWIFYSERRFNKFFKGDPVSSFERIIKKLVENNSSVNLNIENMQNFIDSMNNRLARCTKRAHLIRFNAFGDTGGNQSFAICLLDEDGNGAIISSLYARDRNTVYAKPIEKYTSKHELTNEEKEAIKKSKNDYSNN